MTKMNAESLRWYAVILLVAGVSNVKAFLPPTKVSYRNYDATTTATPLAFVTKGHEQQPLLLPSLRSSNARSSSSLMVLYAAATMKRIPAELEDVPIPFIDPSAENTNSNTLKFIECYADCTAEVNGIEYTIAVPCDYCVSLCYASEDDPDELIPIEVTDTALMDDIFPIAESIVAEEYGEDLALQRTPETLTLVGELELDDDDEDEDEDYEDEDDDDEEAEEVDVLLSFEHRGKEYQLVRIKDPILLVGKKPPATADDATSMETRLLLTKEESDEIMPTLEDMYLDYQKELEDEDEDEMEENTNIDEKEDNKEDDDTLAMTAMDSDDSVHELDDDDDDDEYKDVIVFYDREATKTNTLSTISCYVDKVYTVDYVEYTIATPCDYVVSICTTEAPGAEDEDEFDGELNPIDIEPDTTKIMDMLFPLAAQAIQDEFDGEMTLTRTAQYMTLVGDIDLDAEMMENDDDEEYDDDEEEVQVLLTFEKDGVEYTLVREIEPMLLVGKQPAWPTDEITKDMRVILDATESDAVVPTLMEMYNDDMDDEEDEE